ncbi:MAG TPA: carbon-nitrogen hydrolase family protein [Rhizomicrobium sp.]
MLFVGLLVGRTADIALSQCDSPSPSLFDWRQLARAGPVAYGDSLPSPERRRASYAASRSRCRAVRVSRRFPEIAYAPDFRQAVELSNWEFEMPSVAIVQQAPVLLDKAASLGSAVAAVREAAAKGANIVVFPEAFIPGYPAWIWRLRPGTDARLTEQIHSALFTNAVDLGTDDLAPLRAAAREHKVCIVCGLNEREGEFGRGTLYNTVVVIGPDGTVLNRHRKLMPTNPERMVWGMGDASGLKTVATPHGRLSALICWENYMPLARYAVYAQGVEIYVAPTYDAGETWISTMRHIAREGGCWVVGSGFALQAKDIPASFPGKAQLYPDADEWINPGDSVVVAPGGKLVVGPLHKEYGLLYAEIDLESIPAAKRTLDTTGHYARPDIFHLAVNRSPSLPIEFQDASDRKVSTDPAV